MKLDSAIELQSKVFDKLFNFAELPVAAGFATAVATYVDPVLMESTSVRSRSERRRVVEDVALGVADNNGDADDVKLAVLVQNRMEVKGALVERIVDMARNEAEVIYIGRQHANWTRTRRNPIRLGCSVAPATVGYAGTLGCFCNDQASNSVCILSNNHVLADVNRVATGTRIVQPAIGDGGTGGADDICELLRYVPIQFGGVPNMVDAAIARIISHSRNEDRAGIYDSSTAGSQTLTLQPGSPRPALPGMTVFKTGRTTRHTRGKVRAINVNNYLVNMGIGTARFDGQIVIEMDMNPAAPFSRPGDSGSIVVDDQGRPLGLLFAGSQSGGAGNLGMTGANPISNVLAQLGVTLI